MTTEMPILFSETKDKNGLSISYQPQKDGGIVVAAISESGPQTSISLDKNRIDEAHILYMEATELLSSRAKVGEDPAVTRRDLERLFALYRGETVVFEKAAAKEVSRELTANPGKKIEIDVDGVTYLRLPVKTRLITMEDHDIVPLVEEYVRPHLQEGDIVFVSEKALTITQGRVVDMSTIHPSPLARLFARNVGNNYGSQSFRGFGHGTDLAMQLFLEEAGYPRVIFAAIISAITRPFGIRGLFYAICGKRAKSIDCPMSFLILEYAHSAKLAPNHPDREAKRIKAAIGREVVILDANYRGAFSLGKSTRAISEEFIGKLFRDNPLGQSDEMTPFCIARKATVL